MANTRVILLFVLTLLQLCRAEISDNKNSDNLPEWYSANVINDGFQPKSISEIFSTESPFSSTNPIVVLPKLTPMPDKVLSSTLPPPSSISGDFTKTSIIPLYSTTPSPNTISTVPPQFQTDFSSRFPLQIPQVEITQYTEQTQPPSESLFETQPDLRQTSPSIPPYNLEQQTTLRQTSPSIPPNNLEQQTTLLQDTPSSSTGRFVVPLKDETEFPTTIQQSTLSTQGPLPNYIVLYQQAPQNPQGISMPGSLQGGLFGAAVPQQSSSSPGTTVLIQPTSTASPQTSRITSSEPVSTPERPTRTSRDPTTGRPATGRPTTGQLETGRPTTGELTTAKPTGGLATQFIRPNENNYTRYPLPIRVRVVGRGSITHVNINPPIPIVLAPTTTTRRPTTTRTRKTPKPKPNTYEACLSGCKARRNPICAIPLSSSWINPNKLKGFPSICHMACFNSYKKEPYEKLLDGRCGRLKTRIQTIDSDTKLTRKELNKAQYVVDNGDQTIVEVETLRHK